MSTPSSLTFADILHHHRAAAGLTQEELAARAGLSVDAISLLERGARRRPRKDTVTLLADALALRDEERAAFAAAARRSAAAAMAATPAGAAPSATARDDYSPTATRNADAASAAPAAALPHGSVTFLFADVEGSTRLLHHVGGDRYADVLAEVQSLVRSVWAAHAGHELGTQGDRFFVVFAYADDALAAAVAAQQALAAHSWPDRWPPGTQVRVRMGVHSGSAMLTTGRYVGLEVHRAARIAAAGHGGQVVVSHAVAEQVDKFGYELPSGTRLRDLGTHRLQDLPQRERLYQLVLPELPGVPTTYPPLRTLDAWPGLRANLTGVALLSVVLLAGLGLLLPLVVPVFPWAIGLGAAGLAALILASVALARPVQRVLQLQWRNARKPLVAVTSALLSLVVVSTTLFITKPPVIVGHQHLGYDFSYTYHQPTHTGGAITVGLALPLLSLAPLPLTSQFGIEGYLGLWQSCLTQLPDLSLGLVGWKADQCTEVPTLQNRDESPDGRTTTFHIDPRAVWSDGVPITADDYMFAQQLLADPNIYGAPPFNLMTLTTPDPHTVVIHWSVQYGDYLSALATLIPLPLHVYATGKFASLYNPHTGTYNTTLAQALLTSPDWDTTYPVDDGPFIVKSFVPNNQAVLVRNSRFFSNFFHRPALDQITLTVALGDFAAQIAQAKTDPSKLPTFGQMQNDMISHYRQGGLEEVEGLVPTDQLSGIPTGEVITSPDETFIMLAFNRRPVAPNARANGGASMFDDINVRKAFVEAFDRCAAVRALLGRSNCSDPNLFSDELTARSAPDYDPTFKLPGYYPKDAARLLDRAGYRVVGGVRCAKDGKTPLQLSLAVSFGANDSAALAMQMRRDYARNLGIDITITSDVPGNPFFQKGAFDLTLFAQKNLPDPVNSVLQLGGGWDSADIPSVQSPYGPNFLGLVDPYVTVEDQLGSEAIDGDQRAAVYQALQRYVSGLLDIVPVYMTADITLTKPTLCNFKKWPQQGFNLWNMADWYVAPSCPA